jgi:hypothetical protein
MKASFLIVSCCAATLSAANLLGATAQETAAQEIATLFRAARAVLSDNQALINDPEKGDKGLSPAVAVEKTKANFAAGTGKPVNDSDPNLKAMLEAVAAVMTDAQPLINEKGKGFKGFLPAVFARQVAERTNEKLSGKVFIKLTAPKEYLRNRSNRPDEWENNVLENKFRSATWTKGAMFGESGEHKGRKGYRLALPEYYGQSCLSCHGGPKGERDITGGLKEGALLDALGGAVIVVVYDN